MFSPLEVYKKDWKFILVGIILIIIGGIKFYNHLQNNMDILFWDEANYLSNGLTMFNHIPKTWGPTYATWYKLLSYIQPDRLLLYYFNYKLTAILICVLLFIFFIQSNIYKPLALFSAFVFLLATKNFSIWPHISHFCIIVILGSLIASNFVKNHIVKTAIISFGFLICAYARPELYISFMLFFALAIVVFFCNYKKSNWIERSSLIMVFLFALIMAHFLGTAFTGGDSQRSTKVFVQHLAINYMRWNHLDMSNIYNWDYTIKTLFKEPTTLKNIFQYPLFWKHILYNINIYFKEFLYLILDFFSPFNQSKIAILYKIIIAFFSFFIFVFKSKFSLKNNFLKLFNTNKVNLITLFLLAFPSYLSCIYAFPRDHYLILQIPILYFIFCILISSFHINTTLISKYIAVFFCFIIILFPIDAKNYTYFDIWRKEKTLDNKNTILFLKKYNQTDTLKIIDTEGNISSMLPQNYISQKDFYIKYADSSFVKMIEVEKINIIYVTNTMLHNNHFKNDTTFTNIIKNYTHFGFQKIKIDTKELPYLLIQKK